MRPFFHFWNRWFCPAVALLLAVRGAAADVEYSPRAWQTDEGLPNNRVQSIAQTPDGYLWIGTSEGLADSTAWSSKPTIP